MNTKFFFLSTCFALLTAVRGLSANKSLDSLMRADTYTVKYTGLLDLPGESLRYALNNMSDEQRMDFTRYGLCQIYLHPDKAVAYSSQLQEFLVEGTEPVNSIGPYEYGTRRRAGSMRPLSLQDDINSKRVANVPPGSNYDQNKASIIETVVGSLESLMRFGLILFIIMSTLVVTAGAVFYKVARSRGTTFILTLKRDELTTEF